MQQLRFHVGTADLSTLQIINVNMGTLAPEHRALIRKRMHDSGNDIWHLEWSRTIGGERSEHSQIQRSNLRVVATEASLPALLEALQANERELLELPTRKMAYV